MTTCKNCSHTFEGNYCNQCGQKDFDPPFDVKEFFSSDVKNEFIGFDGGFVFTIKNFLFKPGLTIYNFIKGVRVGFIQPFAFVLVALAFAEIVNKYAHASDFYPPIEKDNFITKALNYLTNDPKWLMVLIIPIVSKISSALFKKYNVPFGDHFLFNIYALSMLNIIQGLCLIPLVFSNQPTIFDACMTAYGILSLVYYFIIVYQFFTKTNTTLSGTMIRSFLATGTSLFLIIVIFTFLAILENIL